MTLKKRKNFFIETDIKFENKFSNRRPGLSFRPIWNEFPIGNRRQTTSRTKGMVIKMKEYIIPNALQIVIDDLGWFNGKDDRKNGGPSRTAMPRNHVAEDYLTVNEL